MSVVYYIILSIIGWNYNDVVFRMVYTKRHYLKKCVLFFLYGFYTCFVYNDELWVISETLLNNIGSLMIKTNENEPKRAKMYFLTCSPNDDLPQPAQTRSLLRASSSALKPLNRILGYPLLRPEKILIKQI